MAAHNFDLLLEKLASPSWQVRRACAVAYQGSIASYHHAPDHERARAVHGLRAALAALEVDTVDAYIATEINKALYQAGDVSAVPEMARWIEDDTEAPIVAIWLRQMGPEGRQAISDKRSHRRIHGDRRSCAILSTRSPSRRSSF